MLESRTTDQEVGYRQLSLDEWERLKQQVSRRAHDDRAGALRALFGRALLPIRKAAVGLAAGAAATARRWRCAYATWYQRRQAIRELGALDDRALKDFGINRSEIESVVYGRYAEPVAEGKVAAFLFHKPYDRPTERRIAEMRSASMQRIDKDAA